MSVIKSKRSKSDVEFLNTARELELYTIRTVVNFPKRYTFYVSQPLANLSTSIYSLVKEGNSIYPQNKHESQMRIDCFLKAVARLQALVGQVEMALELFPAEYKKIDRWMELIAEENRLLKAVIKKERTKYKDLP